MTHKKNIVSSWWCYYPQDHPPESFRCRSCLCQHCLIVCCHWLYCHRCIHCYKGARLQHLRHLRLCCLWCWDQCWVPNCFLSLSLACHPCCLISDCWRPPHLQRGTAGSVSLPEGIAVTAWVSINLLDYNNYNYHSNVLERTREVEPQTEVVQAALQKRRHLTIAVVNANASHTSSDGVVSQGVSWNLLDTKGIFWARQPCWAAQT